MDALIALIQKMPGGGDMSAQALHIAAASTMAVLMFTVMALCAIVFTLMERKVAGFIQSRFGPMRTGRWHGWAQAVADMLKILGKEDIIPAEADKPLFAFAPILVMLGSLLAWAAIPWAPGFVAADLDLGLFYIFAVSSLVIIGILMAGWASNNKWALYGAARGAAQMISYEIPLALATIPVIMYTGSLNTQDIVIAQQGGFWNWYIVRDPFMFVAFWMYFIASIAETNRGPFDMPETESELVAGYHVEYTGMRFAFFFLSEYANLFLVSLIASMVFLGGWWAPFPFLDFMPPALTFIIKGVLMVFFNMWVRWTLPRVRVDQLMHLCWKVMIPIALICVLGSGIWQMASGQLN
ncbi:MAG: NADH-quinone oxidoreductase subunit NuoH [Candidatus Krumholzibacteria bacterium]|nr:NADH-quinone oxidoreductase subunit NuoH [Candidatus Krumholzibacteria bacterium]